MTGHVDAPRSQIVTFDPTSMTITGELSVPELEREGYEAFLGDVQKVGDRYLATMMYYSSDGLSMAVDSTFGIVVQADPERPLTVLRDERGTGAQRSFVDDAGDFYALADGGGGWYSLTGQQSSVLSPRLLRVKSGANEVDPDYLLDLGELFGTPAANGLWHVGGSKFALQVWGPDLDPAVELQEVGDYDIEPNFDWWLVDAVTRESTPIAGLSRGVPSYSLLQLRDGNQTYVQQYVLENDNYAEAHVELYALGADAVARKVAQTTRGDLRVMARVSVRQSP